jgi:hypothetical protein
VSEPLAGQPSDVPAVPLDEPTPAPAPAPELPPTDPLEPYRRWATTLFTILVLVGIVGTVAVLGAMPSQVVFWVLVASVVLFIATLLVVIAALHRRESWAVHAIAPICYVIVATAVLRVVVALSDGMITIPLEGIGALMVLTRDHRAELLPPLADQGRWRVLLAVGAIAVVQVLPQVTGPIVDGGPFGLQAESLDLQIAMDCTAVGDPGVGVPVRATWSWGRDELFPPAVDGLVVQWAPSGAFVADGGTMSDPAIWSGAGAPAAALIQPLTQDVPSREFGIDVAMAGLIDGSVELRLHPSDPTATSGSLSVSAAYAHGDRWLKTSETTACAW